MINYRNCGNAECEFHRFCCYREGGEPCPVYAAQRFEEIRQMGPKLSMTLVREMRAMEKILDEADENKEPLHGLKGPGLYDTMCGLSVVNTTILHEKITCKKCLEFMLGWEVVYGSQNRNS